jgi:IS605 OrfB family transposase
LGGKVTSQVHVAGLAVELGKLGLEVRAHRPHDLFHAGQVRCGEHRAPVLGHEDQVSMQDEDTVPASAYVPVAGHETKYSEGVQLRYNYRLYPGPGQRQALARAFGCARVVFNDALRARQEAHAAGLPYITDRELSAQLTAAKASPERAWLGEVSSVVLQNALADLNADWLHKESTRIIRDSQAVYVEDLCVSGLGRTRLAKSVHDAGWSAFTAMLEYKARKHGRTFARTGRFEPTSQTCSACGVKDGPKPLSIRAWTCAACGTVHDRDVNAARNIAALGRREAQNVCGGTVRPGLAPAGPGETETHRGAA